MFGIVLDDVTKTWSDGPSALDHLSLVIEPGELFSVVGPSGCGKTTVLRIVGGLDSPTTGRVLLGDRDITQTPPNRRGMGLVTQQNQLLGHRKAGASIRFPLEMRDPMAREGPFEERMRAEADELGIAHLVDRSPRRMSAGERRLVQLARAVIGSPTALLMDEPLAHLEDQVRLRVRGEIVRLHRDRGLTSILVTASQHDAMAMSDRIAVLFGGVLHQIGSPWDVYDRPATADVAAFFGEPAMNVVPARVSVSGPERRLDVLGTSVAVWTSLVDPYAGGEVLVGVRPEDLVAGDAAEDSIEVVVRATEPLGRATLVGASTRDGTRVDCTLPGAPPPIGLTLDLGLRAERLHLFDPATGLAILHPAA